MRRGVAGVRLCDRPACAHRWPCDVHGTASVGDYEHLGRHAGAYELSTGGDVLDVTSCGVCGFALCSCPPVEAWHEALPDGWLRTGDDAFSYRDGVARIEYRPYIDTWFVWVVARMPCPIRYADTREFAMAEAERLAAADAERCGVDFCTADGRDDNSGALGA